MLRSIIIHPLNSRPLPHTIRQYQNQSLSKLQNVCKCVPDQIPELSQLRTVCWVKLVLRGRLDDYASIEFASAEHHGTSNMRILVQDCLCVSLLIHHTIVSSRALT